MAYKGKTFLAIIPARAGSKGLPGKNIIDLCGKPLVVWSIEAGLHSSYIDEVVVSSDSDEILNIAKKYHASTIKRPSELASDSANSESVIHHVVESFKVSGKNYDYLVLLQPTSPLRTANDIDTAIEILFRNNAKTLISVYELPHTPYKAFTTNAEGFLEGIVDNESPFKRRQDLPPAYMSNGAIYIVESSFFKQTQKLFSSSTIPFIMPIEKSYDIDTIDDLKKVEKTMNLEPYQDKTVLEKSSWREE